MADENTPETLIAQWRAHLLRSGAVNPADVEELESHLREQMAALVDAGLAVEEAFLVAVKRMGNIDAVSREFARVHSERLWKQLVAEPAGGGDRGPTERTETAAVVGLALAAAAAIKVPELFGHQFGSAGSVGFYARNASLFILPLLTGYFVWKRGWEVVRSLWLAVAFVAATVLANAFPFTPDGATGILSAIHLPIALWLAVGIAYAGGRWNSVAGRMDFVRFSGELFIYYVLFALGGGVLALFTGTMFRAIGLDVGRLIETWLLPCGALGAVIVGAWLVERKKSVIENMAPVLTRVFTPLFAAVLLAFLVTMVWTGSGIDVDREVLIGFDLLLVLVVGLLLFAVSARDPQAPRDAFDALQQLLVVAALVVDVVALAAIAARISEFGLSANKVAALGENLILLVNLAGSAWLYARFLRGAGPFAALERWQTGYLPVYAVWAALVVVVFPPLFGYR